MPAGGAPCVIAVARLAAEHDHKHNARDRDEQQCGRPRAAGVVQAAEAQRKARQQQRPPQLAGSARRRPTERVSRAAPQGRQDREQQPRPPEFRARRAAVKVRVVREKAADSFHRPNGAHGGGRAARQTSHGARAAGCPAPRSFGSRSCAGSGFGEGGAKTFTVRSDRGVWSNMPTVRSSAAACGAAFGAESGAVCQLLPAMFTIHNDPSGF